MPGFLNGIEWYFHGLAQLNEHLLRKFLILVTDAIANECIATAIGRTCGASYTTTSPMCQICWISKVKIERATLKQGAVETEFNMPLCEVESWLSEEEEMELLQILHAKILTAME